MSTPAEIYDMQWVAVPYSPTILTPNLKVLQLMAWLWTPRLHHDISKFTHLEPIAYAFETRKKEMYNPKVHLSRAWIDKWLLALVKELEGRDSDWVSEVFTCNLV